RGDGLRGLRRRRSRELGQLREEAVVRLLELRLGALHRREVVLVLSYLADANKVHRAAPVKADELPLLVRARLAACVDDLDDLGARPVDVVVAVALLIDGLGLRRLVRGDERGRAPTRRRSANARGRATWRGRRADVVDCLRRRGARATRGL